MNTLQPFDAYSRYYDLLYRDKDYAAEADSVTKLLQRFAPQGQTLLEFGCGTGKHAQLLSERGYAITGVERSATMLAKAPVSERIHYVEADIRHVQLTQRFDAVMSLFHVVSYMTSNADVQAVFARAAEHLNPNGLFVFDVWYAPAVLKQRPDTRVKRMQDAQIAVTRIAEPVMHPNENRVDVNYTVFVQDLSNAQFTRLNENHPMRYFSLLELDLFAANAGFSRLYAGDLLNDTAPSEDTWGVCCVFQKG